MLQIVADFRQDSSTQTLLQMYLSFNSNFLCVSVKRMLYKQKYRNSLQMRGPQQDRGPTARHHVGAQPAQQVQCLTGHSVSKNSLFIFC